MKKLICIFLTAIFCLIFIKGTESSAYNVVSPYNNKLTDEMAVQYISEHKLETKQLIINALDEISFGSTENISGSIKISYPFSIPLKYANQSNLNKPDELLRYCAVICRDRIIGFIEMAGSCYENTKLTQFYYINEKCNRNIDDGISFFCYDEFKNDTDEIISGSVAFRSYYLVSENNDPCIAYYDCSCLADEQTRNLYLISNDKAYKSDIKLSTDKTCNYNLLNADTRIIYSFKYAPKSERLFDKELYVKNGDKYLTYVNGKYTLSEFNGSNNQRFIFSQEVNGKFHISPAVNANKKMSVSGTTDFDIYLVWLNEYCYIISVNDERVMTANNTTLCFASDKSKKYDISKQKWTLHSVME